MAGVFQEYEQEGICRDGKNALDDKSPDKSIKRVFAGFSRLCMEVLPEGSWNNFIKVNVFFKKGQKSRFVRIKNFLTICKNICQRKLIVCYHIYATPFLVCVDCF